MTFGFIGPGYQSQSIEADGERCVNLYPEKIESGRGKAGFVLYPTPGLKLFATLPTGPIRGLWAGENRLFAVGGSKLYEVFNDGVTPPQLIGDVGISYVTGTTTPTPVQMFANRTELFIVSAGGGYISPAPGGTYPSLARVVDAVGGCYIDGYYVAQRPDSNQFNLSNPFDGTVWDPLAFASKSGAPDNLAAVLADHEQLYLIGEKTIEVWYDSGAANFPFQRIQGAFIEQGCSAPFSVAQLDNSVFWLGGDTRGAGVVWKLQGYTPTRVSNHAVENAIQSYSTIADCISYPYQDQGHSFLVLHFPTAGKTWVYDVEMGPALGWHERGFWDATAGQFTCALGRYHAYEFNQHLVGDYRNGNIYTQAIDLFDDAGSPIRRLRSAPHICDEQKIYFYKYLKIDAQMGVVPAAGQGSAPLLSLRISDDGGRTWSNLIDMPMGKIGQYRWQAKKSGLGRSRDRCYEVSCSEPIQMAFIEAYSEARLGNGS